VFGDEHELRYLPLMLWWKGHLLSRLTVDHDQPPAAARVEHRDTLDAMAALVEPGGRVQR
jgi:hypothetical protein